MSRLSLNDWYRYLESQFVEEERAAREEPPSPVDTKEASRADEAQDEHPVSHAVVLADEPRGAEVPAHGAEHTALREMESHQNEGSSSVRATREAYALVSLRIPHFRAFVPLLREELGLPAPEPSQPSDQPEQSAPPDRSDSSEPAARLRKHRPRKSPDPEQLIPPEMDEVWAKLPRYLRYLAEWSDDSVTDKYYPVRGRESREELIARLTDPVLTLEEVARLLGVCPATVRRYTNRGWLRHFRTEGNQRRFRLSDIVAFLEAQMNRIPQGNRRTHNASGRRRRS